jgi:hypothetical protein
VGSRISAEILDPHGVIGRKRPARTLTAILIADVVCATQQIEAAMKEWALYVMTWASQLSGYPLPDTLPEVQLKSASWFSHRACQDHTPCPVFGLYEDGDVVFLRDDLTDSAKDHIAVHEFVHYLQHHSGRYDLNSCFDTDKREQEAFQVQSRFVAEVQGGFERFMGSHLACSPER